MSRSSPYRAGTGQHLVLACSGLGLTQGCIHLELGGTGPDRLSLLLCNLLHKAGVGRSAASSGGYKVGAASPAHIHSRVRMTAALPSLALALLCLLQAGAQVPVQPDLDTEKVSTVLPATSCLDCRGWLGQGPVLHSRAPASPIPEPAPGQLPGEPVQNQVSPGCCVQHQQQPYWAVHQYVGP